MKTDDNILVVKLQGGLGNQMFQYAFYSNLKSLGKKVLLDSSCYKKNGARSLKIWEAFHLPEKKAILNLNNSKLLKYNSPFFIHFTNKILSFFNANFNLSIVENIQITENDIYYPNVYFNIRKGLLDGYWQSEFYFENIANIIPSIFNFNPIHNTSVLKLKLLIENTKDNVSLHWRRGDYIGHKLLGIDLEKYFMKALSLIIKSKQIKDVFVFTEDTKWVKNKLYSFDFNLRYHFISEILTTHEDFHELYLMTFCSNNIISNSSFSWWGAYLNQSVNKIVVAPKKWVKKDYKILFNHIHPSEWYLVDVE